MIHGAPTQYGGLCNIVDSLNTCTQHNTSTYLLRLFHVLHIYFQGADVVGSDDLVTKIQAGEINFDTIIATPTMMSMVGKVGRVSSKTRLER